MTTSAYYYVYNPMKSPPKRVHFIMSEAIKEAERLAKANPGQRFEVLCCIGFAKVEPAPSVFTHFDDIPF